LLLVALPLAGAVSVTVGATESTVRTCAFDVAPDCGLTTVIRKVPSRARSAPGTVARSWLLLTKLVARGAPFHCTTERRTKSLPLTVSVRAGPPPLTAVGLKLLIAGVRTA